VPRRTTLSTFGLIALALAGGHALANDRPKPSAPPAPVPPESVGSATGSALSAAALATPRRQESSDRPAPRPQPAPSPDETEGAEEEGIPGDPILEGEIAPVEAVNGLGGRGGIAAPPERSRRAIDDEKVTLGFRKEKIESLIPFIQEWTGKAVMLRLTSVAPIEITLINDEPISKHEALDLLFQAFRLNGIGVVETDKVVMIELLTDMGKIQPSVVLGPDVDVMAMREDGNIVVKVFRARNAKASDLFDRLQDSIPDYAKLSVDANSNQLVLDGDVGLAKKVQLLLDLLDVPPYVDVVTETFRIKYQDADTIAQNIRDLFEGGGAGGGGRSTGARATNRAQQRPGQPVPVQQAGGGGAPPVGTSEQLVVTTIPSLNSLTIRAEPQIMRDIRRLIETAWDLQPTSGGSIFRTYDLKYTDPLKVRELLDALLAGGSGGSRTTRAAAGGRAPQGGGGGDAGADVAVANIFKIEAYPDSNRLVVISKAPDNFKWLDAIIDEIDQPLQVGLPVNVQLKHASAIEVAEILNALLAQSGAGSGVRTPEQGLSGIDFSAGSSGTGASTPTEGSVAQGEEIRFPWQQGRTGTEEQTEVSALVGKSRVVPNAGQNSLLILAPPEIQTAVLDIVEELDRPGRQVMITAVLAEVSLGDGFSWGLRIGSNLQTLNGNDNAVGGEVNLDLAKGNTALSGNGQNFASPWFDVSFLDVGTSVGFLLQALATNNDVRILQQPRVFTSDNKEAIFFAGQDVTFQTGSASGGNTGGDIVSQFDQQAVGIGLNVRPRITRDRNVAMEIEILLSNLNPALEFNSNPVVDRRQTNTTVTIKDGQTIVISGIRVEEEVKIKRAIPVLGQLPVLEAAFSSIETQKTVKELVMFVTPIVVDNPDANDTNFNVRERKRLESLSKPLDQMSKDIQRDSGFFKTFHTDEKGNPIDPDEEAPLAPGDLPAGDGVVPIPDPVDAPAKP
jgi:general secretion pathway protein D